MGSTFGRYLRATTFGESHGPALGVVLDGVPAGLAVDLDAVAADLARRRPGQSPLTTPRAEADRPEVLSGLFEGRTTGAPLAFLVRNEDADPSAYAAFRDVYRPSHADWTTELRYGVRDWRGGGRASARETVGRVAAGAVARQMLAGAGVTVVGWVDAVGEIDARVDPSRVTRAEVDAHPTRCPDPAAAERMAASIQAVRVEGDTIGGIVGAVARGMPGGLGEPVADKLEAALAGAMLSLPASRGFEIGSGFGAARMRGSAHNDALESRDGRVRARTNHAGGVLGGISTGEDVVLRVAFKPVATLPRPQHTVDVHGNPVVLEARGRHDPCVVPRAVPMVEAMLALVLADAWLGARLARLVPAT